MFLIRDIFRCKPGKAGALARMFLKTVPSMETEDGFRNVRVMTDYVATYWTVVLQAEVEEIAKFDGHMKSFSARGEGGHGGLHGPGRWRPPGDLQDCGVRAVRNDVLLSHLGRKDTGRFYKI